MSMDAKVHLLFDDTANRARGDVLPDLLEQVDRRQST
jgi:hypothetical protein